MKKFISSVLIFSLILSLITVPVAALEIGLDDSISSQMAQAYLNVIDEITDEYGVAITDNYEIQSTKGLYYVELVDFDGDGQKELYLLYAKDEITFKDSIWGFDGSKAYLIGENIYQPGGTRTFGELGLKQVGNKTYLCFGETDSYADTINGEPINIEGRALKVQEVNGKELQIVTYVYSLLHYDDDYEKIVYEEYSKGTNYQNLEPISVEKHKEISEKYSLNEEDKLFRSGGFMFDYLIDNYSPMEFIYVLKDKLMSSDMKDIYTEKSYEEKQAIRNFLNRFAYMFHYGYEYDISDPDEMVIGELIISLLSRQHDIIEYEDVDSDDDQYSIYAKQWKYKEKDINKMAIELFGRSIDFQKQSNRVYDYGSYSNGYIYVYQATDAIPTSSIKINNIYSLGNGLLFMYIDIHEIWDPKNEDIILNSLYEELPSSIKLNFSQMRQGYAIIKEVIKDGKVSYQLIKSNTKGKFLTEEQLKKYIAKVNPEPNISFDYSKVKDFNESSQYINFFKDIIGGLNGEKPNDKANGEIITYIQHAVENSSTTTVKSSKNKVVIDKSAVEKILEIAQNTKLEFDKILKNNDIILNKNIEVVLRINSGNLDFNKAISVLFDSSIIDALGAANGIRVILGDNQHTVYISSEDFRNIINEIGNISVHIQKDKDTGIYTIVFMDSKGAEISQLPYPMRFSFPADNELASIFVNYKGGSDNWGGQYSSLTKSIEFSTRYSGEYTILENEINISDIGELTESQQRAIKFMVSKGYFGLEGDKFYGHAPLTRYDFTTALVKMFFALDRELETTFIDIEKTNQYYSYVASAQKDQIVKGFTDNTFRGETNIIKEQVIALCGRTLVDKKGYIYPENPKDYLSFVDSDSIANWATDDIAIAVQNGLIDNGGLLMPKVEISRNEGAEILYKLFMLLYDVPPVAVEIDDVIEVTANNVELEEPSGNTVVVIGGLLVVLVLGGVGFYLFKRKKSAR